MLLVEITWLQKQFLKTRTASVHPQKRTKIEQPFGLFMRLNLLDFQFKHKQNVISVYTGLYTQDCSF